MKSFLLALLLLVPELDLGWVTRGDNSKLRVSFKGYESELNSCLASGLSVRFRFEFELCRKRRFWLDDCQGSRVAVSSVEFDQISETYAVTSDLLGDTDLPVVERVTDVQKAIQLASGRSDLTLEWLTKGSEVASSSLGPAYRGRVYAECRGEYSQSMRRLSYILSFGLVRSGGYDSGWVEFKE